MYLIDISFFSLNNYLEGTAVFALTCVSDSLPCLFPWSLRPVMSTAVMAVFP